jgi:hypothetical protein
MATKKKPKVEVFETDEQTLEERLYAIRKDIAELTEIAKKMSTQLMEDMIAKGQRRSDYFRIAVRKTLRVTDQDTAFKWAAERNCIDVNTTKAMQLIRRELRVPEGFNVHETSYLTAAGRQHETDSDDGDGD